MELSEDKSNGRRPVRLLAFAGARDVVGAAETEIELGGAATVEELWPVLIARFPALAAHRSSLRIAVNGSYALASDPVARGDEVALIPPVAGG